jgi:ABC-type sugar transport system ATPase subunit
MATPPRLEASGLVKRFGATLALDGVSFDVAAGEIHAVAGENGAGKSTLMGILSGAHRPDRGTLRWEGRPVALGDVRAARDLGIGTVHQEPQLVPALSVAENLGVGRLPHRGGAVRLVDRRRLREEAVRALAPLRAGIAPDRRVETLPVGERQLVAIARALHAGARLIVLDEPTSSLSPAEIEALFGVLRELRGRGTAIVYVSHRLEELRRLADRVTVLRDGRVVASGPVSTMTADAIVEAMSGGVAAPPAFAGAAEKGAEALLEVRGLSARGRLHDVTLRVHRGEIVGLAGLMGAGRSRLLRTIFGAEPRDGGEVSVAGPEGARRPASGPAGAIAAGLGFVPEDRRAMGLVLGASVVENVGLVTPPAARRLGFLRRGLLREQAARAVEALRIKTPGLDALLRTLSGGNQQKVVLARWLGSRFRVLLLDEPTRGVDVGAKAEIHRHLRALAAGGQGLLVASSELPELLALCDRIYVMRQGRVAGELGRDAAGAAAVLRLATGTS